MDNLPDDWGMYYQTCDRCNQRYHLSGCEVCACAPCATEDCDTIINTNEENICVECEDAETGGGPVICVHCDESHGLDADHECKGDKR